MSPTRSRGGVPASTTLAVLGLGAAVVVAVVLDAHAVRVVAALVGCLVLPGLGWARRLSLRDAGDTAALTVVLSLSATAVVATTMAVLGRWSAPAGLVVLGGVAVLGFVPVRAVGAQAGAFLFGRPLRAPGELAEELAGTRAVDALAAEEEWRDWYADVRQQVDEERRRQEAESEAAEREWREWIDRAHRAADEEPDRVDGADSAVPAWWDWSAGDAGPADDAAEDVSTRGDEGRERTDSVAAHR